MKTLYQWLMDVKGYSEFDAEMTVLYFEGGFGLSESVRKDIKDYTEEYIQTLGWGFLR